MKAHEMSSILIKTILQNLDIDTSDVSQVIIGQVKYKKKKSYFKEITRMKSKREGVK